MVKKTCTLCDTCVYLARSPFRKSNRLCAIGVKIMEPAFESKAGASEKYAYIKRVVELIDDNQNPGDKNKEAVVSIRYREDDDPEKTAWPFNYQTRYIVACKFSEVSPITN